MIGVVKFFDAVRGYGFIASPESEADVMVHYRACVGRGFVALRDGDEVEFEVARTERGLNALAVRRVGAARPNYSHGDLELAYALAAHVVGHEVDAGAAASIAFDLMEATQIECEDRRVPRRDLTSVRKVAARLVAKGMNVGQAAKTACDLIASVRVAAANRCAAGGPR